MELEELIMKAREIAGFKQINSFVHKDKVRGIYGNRICSYFIVLQNRSI